MVEVLCTHSDGQQLPFSGREPARWGQLGAILDAIPNLILVVDQNREVVYANQHAARTLGADVEQVLGKRPGDLMRCTHAVTHGECGSAVTCTTCGTAKAIRAAEEGKAVVQECRIKQADGSAIDLRVSTTPISIDGQRLNLVAMTDTSHENRRQALERIFFHDLLNILGAVTGYLQLLHVSPESDHREIIDSLHRLTETMTEEIRAQCDLTAAENNDLAVHVEALNARELLEHVAAQYRNDAVSHGRRIVIERRSEDVNLRSDRRLLQRIIGNMVKNAIEATAPGGEVMLSCQVRDGHVVFAVHNAGVIPQQVQLQIFQRAFSTKGAGRGLGTYGIRLLGERYLRGRVGFVSNPEEGTVFTAAFPLAIAP